MTKVVAIPAHLRSVLASVLPDVNEVQIQISASAENATGEQRASLRETARQLEAIEQAIAAVLVAQEERENHERNG